MADFCSCCIGPSKISVWSGHVGPSSCCRHRTTWRITTTTSRCCIIRRVSRRNDLGSSTCYSTSRQRPGLGGTIAGSCASRCSVTATAHVGITTTNNCASSKPSASSSRGPFAGGTGGRHAAFSMGGGFIVFTKCCRSVVGDVPLNSRRAGGGVAGWRVHPSGGSNSSPVSGPVNNSNSGQWWWWWGRCAPRRPV